MRFRPRAFWTPRYIGNRLLLAYRQRRNPDLPWWPRDAIRVLDDLLRPTDRVLEWGSGRSTAWLATRVESVHSVEHDAEWHDRVRAQLAAQGLDSSAVRLRSVTPADRANESPYVREIDKYGDGHFSVCLIDGEHRGACALVAVPKLAAGGVLIVDDAHWFIDHPTRSPHSRQGLGDLPGEWAEFHALVAGWRCVWSTDGVTDNAIWIKPCA